MPRLRIPTANTNRWTQIASPRLQIQMVRCLGPMQWAPGRAVRDMKDPLVQIHDVAFLGLRDTPCPPPCIPGHEACLTVDVPVGEEDLPLQGSILTPNANKGPPVTVTPKEAEKKRQLANEQGRGGNDPRLGGKSTAFFKQPTVVCPLIT